MAEQPDEADLQPIENDDLDETPGYKAPAKKTLDEIKNLDAEDDSLRRYKETLLAGAAAAEDDGGSNVVVKKLSLVIDERENVILDLTGDLKKLKDRPFTIKEGINYRLKISFRVKREIVAGLKYHQVVYRKGIRVDKASHMVGSYGPKAEEHEYTTPSDEAPKGMIARGHYLVKSKFVDDDKNVYLDWEWAFDIKKDWE